MRKFVTSGIRVLALLIVAAFAMSGLPSAVFYEPATMNAAAAENIVKVGWLSEVVNWNPLNIEMVEDYVVCFLVFSCLYTYDQDWNGPVRDLAISEENITNGDGSVTTYIDITQNAYFRNSANPTDTSYKLTARDVSWTFNYIKNNTGGAFDWYLSELTISQSGEFQVRIDVDYPKATLLDDIADLPIMPAKIWEVEDYGLNNMKPADLVGSSAFFYDSSLTASWYKFLKAPNYHGEADYGSARTVKVDGIQYSVYSDTSALTIDMNAGAVDVGIFTGDMNNWEKKLGDSTATVKIYKAAVQEPGITDIALCAIPLEIRDWVRDEYKDPDYCDGHLALLDPVVRTAIMMTLNKTYILDVIMGGYATRADSVVPPTYWQADLTDLVPFSPYDAKQYLIDNGWSGDADDDGYLEADATCALVIDETIAVGFELSGIRCQAPNTDASYSQIAEAWVSEAKKGGMELVGPFSVNEMTMINKAWYEAQYDIWVWHWGWGPEPLGGAISCWLTESIKKGGDNCQMPMGGDYWFDSALGLWQSPFDALFAEAMQTLDTAARKVLVDELQQMIYDSHSENPPYYDLGLYGYTDARFTNWGDWPSHSGLPVVSDLLWIWFQLEPAANQAPTFNTPLSPAYQQMVDVDLLLQVEVSDPDADEILVNWTFGDGATAQDDITGDTTAPTVVTQLHPYSATGTYDIAVTIWDHQANHEIASTATVDVYDVTDTSPTIVSVLVDPETQAYIEETTTWTITARDAESGGADGYGLLFTIDWADDTYDVVHELDTVNNTDVVITATHSWADSGLKNVMIYVYDGYDVETNTLHNISTLVEYYATVNQAPDVPTIGAIYGLPDGAVTCSAYSSDPDPDILRFTWDFGNGSMFVENIDTSANPGDTVYSSAVFTWTAVGNYLVTVNVDDLTTDNMTATAVAQITTGNVRPGSLMVTQTPNPGVPGVEVTLNASAADANGDALVYFIDFDDGTYGRATTDGGITTAQYVDFVHTYEAAGLYTVTLYANDTAFNESAPFDVLIAANEAPTITLGSAYSAFYNQEFSIAPVTISDPDGDELTVWYDWGDDSDMTMGTGTTYGATHNYTALGEYDLVAWADDSMGYNESAPTTVTVIDANKKPNFVGLMSKDPSKATYEPGELIWFNMTVTDLEGDELTVTISFGDGATDTETIDSDPKANMTVSFSHSFDEVGEYQVNATVEDDQEHGDTTEYSVTTNVVVEKPQSHGLSMATLAAIAVLVAIVAIIAAVMLMRKRKGKASGEQDGASGMEGMAPPEPPPPQA